MARPSLCKQGVRGSSPLAPPSHSRIQSDSDQGNTDASPPGTLLRRGFRRCLSHNLLPTASDGNREHAGEHGETILAIVGGGIAVVIGVALRRYRHECSGACCPPQTS